MKINSHGAMGKIRYLMSMLPMVVVGAMLVGCDSQPELDTNPEKVEERRQEFISQSQREAEEALPPGE